MVAAGSSTALVVAADNVDKSQKSETDGEANNVAGHDDDDQPQPTVCDERLTKKRHRKRRCAQNFYCTWCKKRFSHRSTLYYHMTIHTGKYKCTECGKCCGNNHNLRLHVRQSHSGEKLFECTTCSKWFRTSSELVVHSRAHHGQKLFKCPVCVEAFRHSEGLDVHMRVHDGETSYTVRSDRSFNQASDVQKDPHYVQSHRQPYSCPYCRKMCKTNHSLKLHVRIHTKQYSCRHCSDRFTMPQQLERHLLEAHSEGISFSM